MRILVVEDERDLNRIICKRLAAGEEIPRVTHPQERVFSEFDSDLDSLLPRGY